MQSLAKWKDISQDISMAVLHIAGWPSSDHCCAAYCLQDGSALTIDLLGSCFTDLLRPPALTPQHISQYLHQGPASVDLRTVGDSPDMTQMQEPSATALNAEASMTSTSMATADLVQGGNGAEMKAAGASSQPKDKAESQTISHNIVGNPHHAYHQATPDSM